MDSHTLCLVKRMLESMERDYWKGVGTSLSSSYATAGCVAPDRFVVRKLRPGLPFTPNRFVVDSKTGLYYPTYPHWRVPQHVPQHVKRHHTIFGVLYGAMNYETRECFVQTFGVADVNAGPSHMYMENIS